MLRNLSLELENANIPAHTVGTDKSGLRYKQARAKWFAFRKFHGYKGYADFTQPGTNNSKVAKGGKRTRMLTLAPADMSHVINTCTWSTPACRDACVLATAGKGRLSSVRRARVVRTLFLLLHPTDALTLIASEIAADMLKFGAENVIVRLNVASDIRWERVAEGALFALKASFYDYTKAPVAQRGPLPRNYRLVYSVSERPASTENALAAIRTEANAAVVFAVKKGAPLPATWRGVPVIDGDVTDDRTQDPYGTIVGLRAKGDARGVAGSEDGFVKPALAS